MFYYSNNYVKRRSDNETIYIADSPRDAAKIAVLMNSIKMLNPNYNPSTERERREELNNDS